MISWSPNTYKCDQSQWRMGEGGMFDVGDTGWLVLLEGDAWFAPLDEPLYERYSCLTGRLGHSPIFADVSITSLQTFSVLSVVGNVVLLCPPLSNVNGKYQQNQRLPVLNFNGGIIILLEVNIESFWCSCPALPCQTVVDLRGRTVVEGKR